MDLDGDEMTRVSGGLWHTVSDRVKVFGGGGRFCGRGKSKYGYTKLLLLLLRSYGHPLRKSLYYRTLT